MTKNVNKMHAKPFMWLFSAQILKVFISLMIQVLVARALLPEGRGIYGICIAISTLLLILTYFGNEFGIRNLLANKRINSVQAFYYLIITATHSLFASIIIVYSLTKMIDFTDLGINFELLLLASILAFSQLIATQINVFITLRFRYVKAAILSVVEELLKIFFVYFLLLKYNSVEAALLGGIIGNLIIILFCIIKDKLYLKGGNSVNIRDLQFIYGYGFRSAWLNISNLSNAHMGTLILSGLMTSAQVGVYSLSFGLIARMQVIPDALNRILVPASMASADDILRFKMLQLSVTGLVGFGLLSVMIFFGLNEIIMVSLFGAEYAGAGIIAFLLLTGFVFKVVGKPIEAHFNEITGMPTVIAGIHIVSITLMTLFTYLGAREFGLAGAAVGSSTALFLSAVALFITYKISSGRALISLIEPRALVRSLKSFNRE